MWHSHLPPAVLYHLSAYFYRPLMFVRQQAGGARRQKCHRAAHEIGGLARQALSNARMIQVITFPDGACFGLNVEWHGWAMLESSTGAGALEPPLGRAEAGASSRLHARDGFLPVLW